MRCPLTTPDEQITLDGKSFMAPPGWGRLFPPHHHTSTQIKDGLSRTLYHRAGRPTQRAETGELWTLANQAPTSSHVGQRKFFKVSTGSFELHVTSGLLAVTRAEPNGRLNTFYVKPDCKVTFKAGETFSLASDTPNKQVKATVANFSGALLVVERPPTSPLSKLTAPSLEAVWLSLSDKPRPRLGR